MGTLAIIGMTIFIILLFSMSVTAGTKNSISALAEQWRWLLLVALVSQVLLLPQIITITPENWKWLGFIGISSVVVCGAANVTDKTDEIVHIVCAAIAFVCFFGWLLVVNSVCLLPLVLCIAAGRERWKWRIEVGLIASVYTTLLLTIL